MLQQVMRLTIIFFLLTLVQLARTQVPEQPNIVLIVIDDLNNYVGFLEDGHPQAITPNLDRLASRGTVFTNAYCNTPQCAPSRTSFLSGKSPDYTKVLIGEDYVKEDFRSNFDSTVFTIPQILKDSGGYYTAMVNKVFHVRNQEPGLRDVDFDTSAVHPCEKAQSWNYAADVGPIFPFAEPDSANREGFRGLEFGYYPDSLERISLDYQGVDTAINILRNYFIRPADFCDKPLFMAIGFNKPHQPFFLPERMRPHDYDPDFLQVPFQLPYNDPPNLFPPNGVVMPAQPLDTNWSDFDSLGEIGQIMAEAYNDFFHRFFEDWSDTIGYVPDLMDPSLDSADLAYITSEALRANVVESYLQSVFWMDEQIGRLLNLMQTRPEIYENTVFIVVSDHGFSLGQKRHWKKVSLWDNVVRIPMIVFDPRVKGGQTVKSSVSLLDLFPTILDIAGVEHPSYGDGSTYLDGRSLQPLLENPNLSWNQAAVTAINLPNNFPEAGCHTHYSVRNERFHYIRYRTDAGPDDTLGICDLANSVFEEELYEVGIDREVDPNEWNNLAKDERYRTFMDYMQQWLPEGPLYNKAAPSVKIISDSIPCTILPSDSILFSADVHDVDGQQIHPDSSGYIFQWTSNVLQDTFYGRDLFWRKGIIDTAIFPIAEDAVLQLLARDPSTNIALVDVIKLDLPAAGIPIADYSPVVEGNQVQIDSYSISREADSYLWEYGNGYSVSEKIPGPHEYTWPGNYLITHRWTYSASHGQKCELTLKKGVFVDTAGLDSLCYSPQFFTEPITSATQVKLDWAPVWNAQAYQIRIQNLSFPGPYLESINGSAGTQQGPLAFNQQYSFEVRSQCDSVGSFVSDWSYPINFTTKPCPAPRVSFIDAIDSNSASISWLPPISDPIASKFVYREASGSINFATTSLDTFTNLIDLEPAQNYPYKIQSMCADLNGSFIVPGPLGPLFEFTTLDTIGSRLNVSESSLIIWPNPSAGLVQLQNPQATEIADYDLIVINSEGRQVMTDRISGGELRGSYQLDLSHLAEGLYWISIEQDKQREWHHVVITK